MTETNSTAIDGTAVASTDKTTGVELAPGDVIDEATLAEIVGLVWQTFAGEERVVPLAPGFAEPGSAEPGFAEPGSAEPGFAEPGSAEPGSAEPGFAEPGSAEPGFAELDEPNRFASISIGGEWTATLLVAMPAALVERFAAALMALPPSELDPADLDDAFGELVNVVGGNVKGLVDDPRATLSLPAVSPSRPSFTGGQLTVQAAFQVAGAPMVWELWERV